MEVPFPLSLSLHPQMGASALNFHQEMRVLIATIPGCYGTVSPPDLLVTKDHISFIEVSSPELWSSEGSCYTLLWEETYFYILSLKRKIQALFVLLQNA